MNCPPTEPKQCTVDKHSRLPATQACLLQQTNLNYVTQVWECPLKLSLWALHMQDLGLLTPGKE